MSTTTAPAAAGTATATVRTRGVRGGQGRAPYWFVAPFVVLFLVFLVAPIVVAIWTSFFTVERSGLGFGPSTTVFAGFENFARAFTDTAFIGSFGRVLLYGVVQVPIMLAFAITLALLFDSAAVKAKRFFQLSAFLPFAVPSVVAALVWGFLYQPGVSPIVEVLGKVGIDATFLAPGHVLWSIANVSVWLVTGVNMIIIFSSLQSADREIYEAARMDGAGEMRIALRIKLPMIAPAVFLTTLFSIIGTLQLFNEPMTMRSITSNVSTTYTPNMAVFAQSSNDLNYASAMAIVLGLVTFVLSIVVSRASNRQGGSR